MESCAPQLEAREGRRRADLGRRRAAGVCGHPERQRQEAEARPDPWRVSALPLRVCILLKDCEENQGSPQPLSAPGGLYLYTVLPYPPVVPPKMLGTSWEAARPAALAGGTSHPS